MSGTHMHVTWHPIGYRCEPSPDSQSTPRVLYRFSVLGPAVVPQTLQCILYYCTPRCRICSHRCYSMCESVISLRFVVLMESVHCAPCSVGLHVEEHVQEVAQTAEHRLVSERPSRVQRKWRKRAFCSPLLATRGRTHCCIDYHPQSL